jgi:hypothetical protein
MATTSPAMRAGVATPELGSTRVSDPSSRFAVHS